MGDRRSTVAARPFGSSAVVGSAVQNAARRRLSRNLRMDWVVEPLGITTSKVESFVENSPEMVGEARPVDAARGRDRWPSDDESSATVV